MVQRKSILMTIVALFAMLVTGTVGVAAQEATPAALFADTMGLPELHVQVTDSAIEGVPAETPAGRYLLTVDVTASDGGSVGFMQLPAGMSRDGFVAMLAGPSASPGPSMATPEGEMRPPDWYYQTNQAGGTGTFAGTAQAIIDLTPGDWIAWGDDPTAPQPPVALTVTGASSATPAAAPEPTANATVSMFEYGFKLDGTLQAGSQVLAVTNVGAQPHFLLILRAPQPISKDQAGQILDLEASGATPAPGSNLPDPNAFVPAAYVATLSHGRTAWIATDLQPGTYVLLCFVPDIQSGIPHAFEGMYDVVTIGGAGTPTA